MYTRIVTIIAAAMLVSACASTPHGKLFPAVGEAPDLATGAGCEAYGVRPTPGMVRVSTNPVFKPHFVEAWKIGRYCPNSGRQSVWGCYHPSTGDAYIVGRDWKVYWHEWCHAKLGPAHTDGRSGYAAADYVAPKRLLADQ